MDEVCRARNRGLKFGSANIDRKRDTATEAEIAFLTVVADRRQDLGRMSDRGPGSSREVTKKASVGRE
jgi:hypothetical protein